MTKEKIFHYLFLTLFCVYFIKEIWLHLIRPMPLSFYFPQNLVDISMDSFLTLSYFIKYFVIFFIVLAFYQIEIFMRSRTFSLVLAVLTMMLIVHRFNFYHYPSLEMYPILALLGFALSANIKDRIFNSIALMLMIYFFSGITKLRYSGSDWLDSEKLFNMMTYSLRNRTSHIPVSDAFLFAIKPWLFGLGVFTFVFECFSPIVLFVKKIRKIFFILVLLFHVLIWAIFNIYSSGVLFPIFILYYFAYEDLGEELGRPLKLFNSK